MTAIVVEDERLPRLALLQKLEDFRQQVEVVYSCDNYDAALRSILQHKPDLLFLDIQLQGRDAIQLLEQVKQTQPLPHVIFTTAYNDRRYLMSAIKLSAVDYLLKPVDKNELAVAIAKAVERKDEGGRLKEDGGRRKEDVVGDRLSFRTVSGRVFVPVGDIAYIRADGNYSMLKTFTGDENVLESLATLERRLDPNVFLRIDRSTIVNNLLLYRLNTRRRQCILRSADGALVELELSKTGVQVLGSI